MLDTFHGSSHLILRIFYYYLFVFLMNEKTWGTGLCDQPINAGVCGYVCKSENIRDCLRIASHQQLPKGFLACLCDFHQIFPIQSHLSLLIFSFSPVCMAPQLSS